MAKFPKPWNTNAQPLGSSIVLLSAIVGASPFVNVDMSKAATRLPSSEALSSPSIWEFIVPFAQYDWNKPLKPVVATPQAVPYNTNLYAPPTQAPFSKVDWSSAFRVPDFLPSSLPYNALIYSEVPFYQDVWVASFDPTPARPQSQPYNVLLLTTGAPFTQLDWSKAKSAALAIPLVPAYNVSIFSEVPFYQSDWQKARQLLATFASLPLNIPLLNYQSTPFSQSDWSKPIGFRQLANVLSQLNIALTTTSIQSPFYQTNWSPTVRIKAAPTSDIGGSNINLFTNNLPFTQTDWSTFARRRFLLELQSYNSALLAVSVQNPFIQAVWVASSFPRPAYLINYPRNANIFSEVPFIPSNLTIPSRPKISPREISQNLPLLNFLSTPFAQLDWTISQRKYIAPPSVLAYNIALLGIVQNPFSQTLWTSTSTPRARVLDQYTRNNLLYSEVPLTQFDIAKLFVPRIIAVTTLPLNINLNISEQAPFYQNSWPNVSRPRISPIDISILNENIYTEVPFHQYDWQGITRSRINQYDMLVQGARPIITILFGPDPRYVLKSQARSTSLSGAGLWTLKSSTRSAVSASSGIWILKRTES